MLEPLSPEGYAATGGNACPACAGTDIANGNDITFWRQVVTRRLVCENCGATWLAVYELTGYEELRGLERLGQDDD